MKGKGWGRSGAGMLALLALLATGLARPALTAPPVTEAWTRFYASAGTGTDEAAAAAVDAEGNVYVTGQTWGGSTNVDYLTVSYDRAGSFRWARTYNDPTNELDLATDLALDASGNVFVTGYSVGDGTQHDYVTVSYDRDGNERWLQRYSGPGLSSQVARSIALDDAGNCYITGEGDGESGTVDCVTVSYDSDGNFRWAREYNGDGNDYDQGIKLTVDGPGNVYVISTSSGLDTGADYATVSYDTDGNLRWVQRYNGPAGSYDYGRGVGLDTAGNVYVTGISAGATGEDYATVSYDPVGNFRWAQRYNGTGNANDQATALAVDDQATALAVDDQGNVLVTGTSAGGGTKFNDFATVSYSSAGEQRWVQRYNGPDSRSEVANAVAVDGSGNVYVTGYSAGIGTAFDFATVSYDRNGTERWSRRLNGPASNQDVSLALALDGSGNVYTTGSTFSSATGKDILTVRYAQNQAPVAVDDSYTVLWGRSFDSDTNPALGAYLTGTLGNDSDADGDSLTAVLVATPQHGSLTVLNGNGSFIYTPDPGYVGADTFTYYATDGALQSGTATVHLTVTNHAPEAVDQSVTTPEDTPLTLTLGASDADQDSLTYRMVTPPEHGTLTGSGNGRTYTPDADYAGSDSFTFKANDGLVDSNTGTISLTISAVNDPPVAAPQSLSGVEDTASAVTLTATDVEGDPLTYTVANGPAHGTLSGTVPTLTYTPAANYAGTDSFTFTASDGQAESGIAVISLSLSPVNDAPIASSIAVSTPEDTARAITLAAADVDGNTLTYGVVNGPAHGALSGTGASRTYTPQANFFGQDSFTYRANDGQVNSNTATVFVTVTAVNDAPAAAPDNYTLAEDGTLTVPAPGVLANDTDVEGTPLTAELTGPSSGSLLFNVDGSFTYTPAANYHGSDSFTYRASDGTSQSPVTRVSLTVTPVNDAPSAQDAAVTLAEDTPTPVSLAGLDVDGDPLTYTVLTQPGHGSLSGAGAARAYTPNPNFYGSDQFTFRVSDGLVTSALATVSLTITPVNDAPAAAADAYTINKNLRLEVTAPGVLGNDSDVEGDALTAEAVSGPAHGVLVLKADGGFSYQPAPNFSGEDTFTYRPRDAQQTGSTAAVTITVGAANNPPTSAPGQGATDEDVPLDLTLSGSDPDGDSLTYSILSPPLHGELTGAGPNRTYRPALDFSGVDSFSFRVSDGQATSAPATVSLTVRPVNDAPAARAGADQMIEASGPTTPVSLDGSGSTDAEGDALTYRWTRNGEVVGTSAQLTLPMPVGQHTLVLTATDPAGATGTDSLEVVVRDTTAPTLTLPADLAVSQSAPTGAPVTFMVTATDAVSDVTVVSTPASGSLFPLGTTTVNVTATDAAGNKKHGTFHVTVATPASTPGRVTARGAILVGGKRAPLSLSVAQKPGRPLKGSLKFTDPGSGLKLKSTRLDALVITGTRAQVFGQGTLPGGGTVRFLAEAEDVAATAGSDRFRLELSDGRVFGAAPLSSGKVKITP